VNESFASAKSYGQPWKEGKRPRASRTMSESNESFTSAKSGKRPRASQTMSESNESFTSAKSDGHGLAEDQPRWLTPIKLHHGLQHHGGHLQELWMRQIEI
jgi:hypothetical protein